MGTEGKGASLPQAHEKETYMGISFYCHCSVSSVPASPSSRKQCKEPGEVFWFQRLQCHPALARGTKRNRADLLAGLHSWDSLSLSMRPCRVTAGRPDMEGAHSSSIPHLPAGNITVNGAGEPAARSSQLFHTSTEWCRALAVSSSQRLRVT